MDILTTHDRPHPTPFGQPAPDDRGMTHQELLARLGMPLDVTGTTGSPASAAIT